MAIIRTYPLKNFMNRIKQDKLVEVLFEYRKLAKKIANIQWKNFYMEKEFNKQIDIKSIDTLLSERYKQTNQYQVVGMLNSYIENRVNDFRKHVYKSTLSEEVKKDLYIINKMKAWYHTTAIMLSNVSDKEYRTIPLNTIKLSRKIFKHLLKKNRKPSMDSINLALDNKIIDIKEKVNTKKLSATSFDYWVTVSTLTKGERIKIPLNSNEFFDSKEGKLKKFTQINYDKFTNKLSLCLIKELPSRKEEYIANIKEDTISVDLGLRNLFATNKGDLIGRNFIDTLYKYDKHIIKLQKELQKHKIKPNQNKRYRTLVKKVRNFIKNEVNRGLNKIIKLHNPAELVFESLNFQSPRLSKRLNRIIGNFGKSYISKKLESFKEIYDIEITYINPAYTSQECSCCGNIDKTNRKSQGEFICTFCNSKKNADINASCILFARSSSELNFSLYDKKKYILDKLLTRFIEQQLCHYSLATFRDRTKDNPYLLEHDLYQKKVL
jgi:putative transposase